MQQWINSALLAAIALLLALILRALPARDAVQRVALPEPVQVWADFKDPLPVQTDPTGGHPLDVDVRAKP